MDINYNDNDLVTQCQKYLYETLHSYFSGELTVKYGTTRIF